MGKYALPQEISFEISNSCDVAKKFQEMIFSSNGEFDVTVHTKITRIPRKVKKAYSEYHKAHNTRWYRKLYKIQHKNTTTFERCTLSNSTITTN